MSQVTVTTTTTTQPVISVCSGAMLIAAVVPLVPSSMGQTTLGQHVKVLPQQLILRDAIRVLMA